MFSRLYPPLGVLRLGYDATYLREVRFVDAGGAVSATECGLCQNLRSFCRTHGISLSGDSGPFCSFTDTEAPSEMRPKNLSPQERALVQSEEFKLPNFEGSLVSSISRRLGSLLILQKRLHRLVISLCSCY